MYEEIMEFLDSIDLELFIDSTYRPRLMEKTDEQLNHVTNK